MSERGKDEVAAEILMIIEDDSEVRGVLAASLAAPGRVIIEAGSGAETERLLEKYAPQVVLLDIGLPDISGQDLLVRLLKGAPHRMVIMITGRTDEESVVKAMGHGAMDYVSKPFVVASVRSMAKKAFARAKRSLEAKEAGVVVPDERSPRGFLVGQSPGMLEVFKLIGKLAASDIPVLITGESGTGKELVAKALHGYGPFASGPFVTVDCAGIPSDLLEAELFGYEKGAFTGSVAFKAGRLGLADGGTLFVDEVGNIPMHIQPKLLRALEEKTTTRLGSNKAGSWNARIVSATNTNLRKLVAKGRFREDLLFRLSGAEIHLPPLREHPDDIVMLAGHFLWKVGDGGQHLKFSSEAMELMARYQWPGNVRELEHAVNFASAFVRGGVIAPEDLPEKLHMPSGARDASDGVIDPNGNGKPSSMRDMKSHYARSTFEACGGNRAETARVLEVDRKTLNTLLEETESEGELGSAKGEGQAEQDGNPMGQA